MIRTSALLTAAILLVASELPGDVTKGRSFHINVPRPGANPIHHIWVPDSVSYFRAIIIRHHGCGTDGFGTSGFYDYQWRYLAERQHCIMVLPEEKSDGGCDEWYNPDNGSYAAMMKAIDSVAGATNHPELRTAPFALWGHSGGADWVVQMINKHTSQIVVGYGRGSWRGSRPSGTAALSVPFCYSFGENDIGGTNGCVTYADFSAVRRAGGICFFDREKGVAHDANACRPLAVSYMDTILSTRLGPNSQTILPVDSSRAWLGDSTGPNQFRVVRASSVPDAASRLQRAWLPCESFARLWKRFEEGMPGWNCSYDTTPPPPPTKLRLVSSTPNSLTIAWEFSADLETGIKGYRVYRNDVMSYDYCQATGRGALQNIGFADENDPGVDTSKSIYTDASVSNVGTFTYTVTTINRNSLESVKSQPLVYSNGAVAVVSPREMKGEAYIRAEAEQGAIIVRTSGHSPFAVRVVTCGGQLVTQFSRSRSIPCARIELAHKQAGFYFVRVVSKEMSITRKLFVD